MSDLTVPSLTDIAREIRALPREFGIAKGVTQPVSDEALSEREAIASYIEDRAADLPPHVGGHPEMPLHPYEPTGDGQCAACLRASSPAHAAERDALHAGTHEAAVDDFGNQYLAPAAEPVPPGAVAMDRIRLMEAGRLAIDARNSYPVDRVPIDLWSALEPLRFAVETAEKPLLAAEPVPPRECVLTAGHQGLHRDVSGNEWSWFETTGHRSPAAELVPLTLDALTEVLRVSPMHWEVRRPDGAYVMTRMFHDAYEAAEFILAALARPKPSAQEERAPSIHSPWEPDLLGAIPVDTQEGT